jgi:hypothetical protein
MSPILYVQYSAIIKKFGEGGGSIQLNRHSQPQLINNFSVYKDGTQTTFIPKKFRVFLIFTLYRVKGLKQENLVGPMSGLLPNIRKTFRFFDFFFPAYMAKKLPEVFQILKGNNISNLKCIF